MPRARGAVAHHQGKKKIFRHTKGYRGGRNNLYRQAMSARINSLHYAYRDRRVRKRNFRQLWIIRINNVVRLHDITYRDFIFALKNLNVNINRKLLAYLASEKPTMFESIVQKAKTFLQKNIEPSIQSKKT